MMSERRTNSRVLVKQIPMPKRSKKTKSSSVIVPIESEDKAGLDPNPPQDLARQLMYGSNNKLKDRGIWYNHSTFIDLILSVLFGFRAGGPKSFSIFPQAAGLDWMAIDNLRYQGHDLSLIWDKDGSKYGKGKGLHALVAGKVVASSPTMGRLVVQLP